MSVYIVTYDLHKEASSEDYTKLIALIKEDGVWACLGESSYLIESSKTPIELRSKFMNVLDEDDSLYVGEITAPAAWYGYSQQITDWIKAKVH